jgi:hypothetical protein
MGRPRDERADRAIVDATLELMAENRARDLRMDDVAGRAGVGKAIHVPDTARSRALMRGAARHRASGAGGVLGPLATRRSGECGREPRSSQAHARGHENRMTDRLTVQSAWANGL